MTTTPRTIADDLMLRIDADLVSRRDLDLAERIDATKWLTHQLALEVDRMVTAYLANGATYQQAADALNVSRQAAYKRYGG